MSLDRTERKLDSIATRLSGFLLSTSLILIFLFYKLSLSLGADPDLFARIAMGRLFVRDGTVPLVDPFAFTEKKPVWIDHEWLSGVVFYCVASIGSDLGLFLFKLACCALTSFLILRASRFCIQSFSFGSTVLALVLLLDCVYLWAGTVRAQVFTYLFLAFLFYQFAKHRKDGDTAALTIQVPLMALWSNLHGGFVLGIILQAFYAFECLVARRPRAVLFVPVLSAVATLVNPYGFEYWRFMFEALTMPRPSITEWAPVLPTSIPGLIPYLFILLFLYGWRSSKERSYIKFAEICFFSYCGLRHERLSALFSFSLIARGLPEIDLALKNIVSYSADFWLKVKRMFVLVIMAGAAYCASILLIFLAGLPTFKLKYDAYPVEAVGALYQLASGKVLVDFNTGSFALWRLYPRHLISVDGRYEEVYPNSTVENVSNALTCNSAQQPKLLSELEPDYILVPSSHSCFREQSWVEVYTSGGWTIYGRIKVMPILPVDYSALVENMWQANF